jgi:lysozyme family protein
MSHFPEAIKNTLKNEGGLVNNPNDPGGLTNFGITMKFIQDRNIDVNGDGKVSPEDIIGMTVQQATDIYKKYIWDVGGYDNISDYWIAAKLFDMDVNMGKGEAGILAQRAANSLGSSLVEDGGLGPKSFAAINSYNPATYMAALKGKCADFYHAIVAQHPHLAEFLPGWLARANWP